MKRTACLFLAIVTCSGGWASIAEAQETATDLPLWFDVSESEPPNIKLNTDLTFQLQNEEQVAVDPTNPNNLVAVWRDFRLGFRQVGWAYSHDGGTNWTEGGLIQATPFVWDSDPAICANSDGVFFSVILSFDPAIASVNGLYIPISSDSGLTWPFWANAVHHVPEFPTTAFEDKEMIVCDLTGGPTDGSVYAPWARFTDTTAIWCARSSNGFAWGDPQPVSDRGSVQWPVPAVGADGRVIVAWWSYARSSIMYDISYDQGATWGTDQVLQPLTFVPSDINGGITTFGFPAMTSDMSDSPFRGRLYCAFEDRAADGLLDMYMTISADSGMTWSERRRINDDPLGNGVDQFHPWTSVNPDGVVSVAFYDRRLDPIGNLLFDLWITHSFDGGLTWTPNQRVSDVSSSPFNAAAIAATDPKNPIQPIDPQVPSTLLDPNAGLIGEYIGLATSRLRATTVFTDTRNGHQDVYAANMPLRLFPPRLVGPSDALVVPGPDVAFDWDDYSFYDAGLTYALEYATDPTFSSGVVRLDGLSGHTHTGPIPPGSYHWRMRAFDPLDDSSAWSEVRSLEVVPDCACDCHADPALCNGVLDVLDVVKAIGVAFRDAPAIPDLNAQCPYERTDTNCDNVTSILDVVAFVNVGFRNENPLTAICDPCP